MKKIFAIAFIFILPSCTDDAKKNAAPQPEQDRAPWFSYYNEDSTRIGFKDKNGVIKTEAKFGIFVEHDQRKFDDIATVIADYYGNVEFFYFSKIGKTFGKDSIYFLPNFYFDCESEGFIRFMNREFEPEPQIEGRYIIDWRHKYLGMFNRNGEIAIPATKYNYFTNVINGMAIALEDAEKHCDACKYYEQLLKDPVKYSYLARGEKGETITLEYRKKECEYCERFKWVGGKEMLIDTLGNVLVDDFPIENELLLFTIQKTATPHPDTIRESFLARDGSYYSFINFKKEFRQWLTEDFLADLTDKKLENTLFDTLYWSKRSDCSFLCYDIYDKQYFIDNDFNVLKHALPAMMVSGNEYNIFSEINNNRDFIERYINYDISFLERYHDNCGRLKTWIYPMIGIEAVHRKKGDKMGNEKINEYIFLRTESGYKLISAIVRSENFLSPPWNYSRGFVN